MLVVMPASPLFSGVDPIAYTDGERVAAQRRTVGRLGGCVIALSALTALGATRFVTAPDAKPAFDLVALVAVCSGAVCVVMPWNRLSARWLHAIPVVATIEVALGARLAGVYGDIAATYYVLIVAFAAYAFRSRAHIAAQVTLVAAASCLPLLYLDRHDGEVAVRVGVGVLLLVVVAGMITALRERLESRQHDLEELAVRDPLTGVGNYRLLAERLDYEIARRSRSAEPMTVMLFDLDGFKHVNDTYGHLIGDRVLCEVAHALSTATRAQDTLARQGGDEFSILAPNTTDEQARRLAFRAQDAVAAATNAAVTTTVGWASYPTPNTNPSTLLALADTNLRRAKRNRQLQRGEQPADPRPGAVDVVESTA